MSTYLSELKKMFIKVLMMVMVVGIVMESPLMEENTSSAATLGEITVVAGTGTSGSSGDGRAATAAQLSNPNGLVVDNDGNLFIVDQYNDRIRKVDTQGVIRTVAGGGNEIKPKTGLATSLRLMGPTGVELDNKGNIYISDTYQNRILKVDAQGNYSTVAGTGVQGYSGDSGLATLAQLNNPMGMLFDSSGNLYIADHDNNRIRKIDADGIITTVVGSGVSGNSGDGGLATSARLYGPRDIELDGSGNLYIADSINGSVRKVDANGIVSTVSTNYNLPRNIEIDISGNIYIATYKQVIILDYLGGVSKVVSKGVNGTTLKYSSDIALDNYGNMYISETDGYRILKVVMSVPVTLASTSQTSTTATFSWTSATDAREIFIEKSPSGENNWTAATTGTIATNATTATVTGLSAATSYDFRIGVRGGDNAGMSNTVRLWTKAGPQIVNNPIDVYEVEERDTRFIVLVTGDSLTYQWQVDSGSGFTNLQGTNNPRLNLLAVTYGMNNNKYRVVVTDSGGLTITSNSATLLVNKLPSVSAVTLASNNDDPARAKAGDKVTMTIVTNEEVQVPTVTIAGKAATVNDGGDNDAKTWTASYVMKEGDSEGVIAFTLVINDLVSNFMRLVTATTNSSSVTYDQTPPTGTVSYSSTGPTNGNVTATVSIDSDTIITNNGGLTTYEFTSNGSFTFELKDGTGNTAEVTATVSGIDKTAPSAVAVTLASNNDNPARAKAGDKVTLTITTNEEVQTPAATIAGKAATVSDGGDDDATTWTASYAMEEDDSEGAITFTLDIKDLLGNVAIQVTATTNSSSVTYDQTPPTGTILYSPTGPTNGNVTATVNIESDTTITNNGGSPTYEFTNNGTFTFQLKDGTGHTAAVTATVSGIDKTAPSVSAVTLASNNANPARAKAGDTITMTIVTNKEVQTPTVTIAGKAATVSNDGDTDAKTWKASYVMEEGDSEGVIAFTLDFEDLVGNVATQVTATTNSSSVTYDQTPPTGTVSYSSTGPTNGNVTATVSIDSDTTITNNGGSPTYEFTSNGTFTFQLKDGTGHTAAVTAAVSGIDKTKPVITLNGESEVIHEAGTPYVDLGVTAIDDNNESLTDRITVTGSVYTGQLGTYVLIFNVTDDAGNAAEEQQRNVHVVDTISPIITLIGEGTQLIPLGDVFVDQGATALDNFEGDLTEEITVNGSVFTDIVGHYSLTYTVTDSSGNEGSAVRTVTIYDHESPVIALIGEATITIEVGASFQDPGVIAWDDQDGDMTGAVSVTGSVYGNQLGTYIVQYSVQDSAGNDALMVNRIVIVVDTTKPIITLVGEGTITMYQGNAFRDPGFTSSDNYDGDVTEQVVVEGTVNNRLQGQYIVTYKVSDSSGNQTIVKRTVNVVSSGQPNESVPTVNETVAVVSSEQERLGTTTTRELNGRRITTIIINEQSLQQLLNASSEQSVITIPFVTSSDAVIVEMNGLIVKNTEHKQVILEISTDEATYKIPVEQFNMNTITEQMNVTDNLEDIIIQVEIAISSEQQTLIANNLALNGGFTILAPPIDFTVRYIKGDHIIEVERFSRYIERMIAIPDHNDPNLITTGIIIESDGAVRHVPTKIVNIDGKYYASIKSLTNSTYAVISHPIKFMDVDKHWAKEAVNDLGSRMVISGLSSGLIEPDRDITRAEFATILVRGLGIKLEDGTAIFSDVGTEQWYSDAIQTAHTYNLIGGFEDGAFRPMDKITREQAMVIVARAMKITGTKDQPAFNSTSNVLQPFLDIDHMSAWAEEGIIDTLEAGIVSGRSNNQLAPGAFITRAEAVIMIQRLLQKSELI